MSDSEYVDMVLAVRDRVDKIEVEASALYFDKEQRMTVTVALMDRFADGLKRLTALIDTNEKEFHFDHPHSGGTRSACEAPSRNPCSACACSVRPQPKGSPVTSPFHFHAAATLAAFQAAARPRSTKT